MKKLTVGILAHVDSGKTTLCEAMLYTSGGIRKLGRVDHRDAFLDNFRLERERGITIFSKQAQMAYADTVFTLIDTPGHVDFSAETERTLAILDYAILVVSGSEGVQSHTLTLWKLLMSYRVPTFIFVNKMDLPDVKSEFLLRELQAKLDSGCVDFTDDTAPEFYENAALCDDALFEIYTESAHLPVERICDAIKSRKVFPCLFGSALKLQGIEKLMQLIDRYTIEPKYGDGFAAKVYKISEDSRKTRLTHLKVTGGRLRVREIMESERNTEEEKINEIRIYSGEKYTNIDEADAGSVVAVTGLSFTRPGDGLGAAEGAMIPLLEPVLSYTVKLPTGVDAHTAMGYFKRLESEDPTLRLTVNERTGELGVRLMGDIQLEVLRELIRERFGLTVEFGQGEIIYRETITNTVEGIGHFEPLRHYAEVHLILRPLPRGSGIRLLSDCREDQLDRNWQRLILTHLAEKTHTGVLTSSPITDIEITLAAGKAHPKHTEGGDFRQATYRALRQGLMSAHSLLLEPLYRFELTVPTENVGRALTDINRMEGSFEPPLTLPDATVISGTAPVATMQTYSREVAAYTHGAGRLSLSFCGYAPCHNADEVIAAIGYDPEADVDNPADSIFCSHGAGHNVKWNEVKAHMHLPSALDPRPASTPESRRQYLSDRAKSPRDFFASDKELMRIFEQTYGPVKKRHAEPAPRRISASTPSNTRRKKPQPPGKDYLLVDGYNVIFSWQETDPGSTETIDAARSALINILCNYQGYKGCELILVFDAYKVKNHDREIEQVGGISIVYTKEAETADTYIEKVSHELSKNNRVRVVTSDRMEQLIILGNGAVYVSSREFREEIQLVEQEIREIIESEHK